MARGPARGHHRREQRGSAARDGSDLAAARRGGEIDVRIEDLKTDALFAQSLPENRRSVYETIFSREELSGSASRARCCRSRTGTGCCPSGSKYRRRSTGLPVMRRLLRWSGAAASEARVDRCGARDPGVRTRRYGHAGHRDPGGRAMTREGDDRHRHPRSRSGRRSVPVPATAELASDDRGRHSDDRNERVARPAGRGGDDLRGRAIHQR